MHTGCGCPAPLGLQPARLAGSYWLAACSCDSSNPGSKTPFQHPCPSVGPPHPARQLKVLAVYGEQDGMRPDYALLEEALPRAQLLLIPGARHACYLDNPQAFNAGLLRFLDGEVAPLRR